MKSVPFYPSNFAEGDSQFMLMRIGRELSQQLAGQKGAAGRGGRNPPDVGPVPHDHVLPDFVASQSGQGFGNASGLEHMQPFRPIPQGSALSVRGRPADIPAGRSDPRQTGAGASHMNGTVTIAQAGPYPYTSPMIATPTTATLIGYARCSTDRQDLGAQRPALLELGVAEDRIYTDQGLTGTTRARPGLDQALAAVRQGDTLVVPKLGRLARSVPDRPHHRRPASGARRETDPGSDALRLGRSYGQDVLQHPRHLR